MMMLVDYGGSFLPIISHSPWIGLHLADFVMPWFLFIAGVSVALVYKVSEWIQPRIFILLLISSFNELLTFSMSGNKTCRDESWFLLFLLNLSGFFLRARIA